MIDNVYLISQAYHRKSTDVWTKGLVVKSEADTDNRSAALQTYHAYLGAYAYGHDPDIDYVYCQIIKASTGAEIISEMWKEI